MDCSGLRGAAWDSATLSPVAQTRRQATLYWESGPGFVSAQTPTLSPGLLILREGSKRFNLGPLISKMEVMSRVWGRGLLPQDV